MSVSKSRSNKSSNNDSQSKPVSDTYDENGRDEDGYTRLMNAILEEDEDLAIELIDAEPLYLDAVNYQHFNALQMACKAGLTDVALQLIDLGVDTHYISGEGFKALDYALDLKDRALKIVNGADSQMRFAAEDEQWDQVCEWRTDKQKHQLILETIEPLIEALQNQDPDMSMEISESDLKESLETQLMRYLRNGRAAKGLEWNPSTDIVITLFFLHLMRTYRNSQCYVNNTEQSDVGFFVTFDLLADKAVVFSDGKYKPGEEKQNKTRLKSVAKQVVDCIHKTKGSGSEGQQVIIPIRIANANAPDFMHMNMLIFREKDWTVEHYEPHGKTNLFEHWNTKEGIQQIEHTDRLLKSVFQELVSQINAKLHRRKAHKSRGDVRLQMSAEICPSHKGFQALHKKDPEFEKSGLCAVWSLFIAELSAMYPGLSLRQIQSGIYAKMQEYDMRMAGEFLMNIIKGYVLHIVESTRVYAAFFDVHPEEWTIHMFKTSPELMDRLSWLCWFETNSYEDAHFASDFVKKYKQGDPDISKQTWQYAEKYLRLKNALECSSSVNTPEIRMHTSPVMRASPNKTRTRTRTKTRSASASPKKGETQKSSSPKKGETQNPASPKKGETQNPSSPKKRRTKKSKKI